MYLLNILGHTYVPYCLGLIEVTSNPVQMNFWNTESLFLKDSGTRQDGKHWLLRPFLSPQRCFSLSLCFLVLFLMSIRLPYWKLNCVRNLKSEIPSFFSIHFSNRCIQKSLEKKLPWHINGWNYLPSLWHLKRHKAILETNPHLLHFKSSKVCLYDGLFIWADTCDFLCVRLLVCG